LTLTKVGAIIVVWIVNNTIQNIFTNLVDTYFCSLTLKKEIEMTDKYLVNVFADEACDVGLLMFKHYGETQIIIEKVEQLCPNWAVIILTELWDNPNNYSGNYWVKSQA